MPAYKTFPLVHVESIQEHSECTCQKQVVCLSKCMSMRRRCRSSLRRPAKRHTKPAWSADCKKSRKQIRFSRELRSWWRCDDDEIRCASWIIMLHFSVDHVGSILALLACWEAIASLHHSINLVQTGLLLCHFTSCHCQHVMPCVMSATLAPGLPTFVSMNDCGD